MRMSCKGTRAELLMETVSHIVERISVNEYQGNIAIKDMAKLSASTIRFTLKAVNSRAYGARTSWQGRHGPYASWEAIRDVLREVFHHFPQANIYTMLADYKGQEGFEREFPKTGEQNIGSVVYPVTMPQLSV